MQSLIGHTSPVESVTFDSEEVLVVSGASSGAIKLWDLEEAKSEFLQLTEILKHAFMHLVTCLDEWSNCV